MPMSLPPRKYDEKLDGIVIFIQRVHQGYITIYILYLSDFFNANVDETILSGSLTR